MKSLKRTVLGLVSSLLLSAGLLRAAEVVENAAADAATSTATVATTSPADDCASDCVWPPA